MNHLRKIWLALWLLVAACGQADKIPEGILSREQMRDILLDMHLADAGSYDLNPSHIPLPDSVRQQRVKVFYRQILDLHGISVQEFMTSYRYYESHPDKLKEVYDQMLSVLAVQRAAQEAVDRTKDYAANPAAFFPYRGNYVISNKQDTTIPFLKRSALPAPAVTPAPNGGRVPLKKVSVHPVKTPKHE